MIFVMVKCCVFFEVQTQTLNIIYMRLLASRLYLKATSSYNRQIRELGQCDPINDKYHRPLLLLSR
jgi:hypothetical protein